ncbi:MAG: DUF2085 domain-containing protein [Chloroflexi bacterium]|nr:DUF2085 domain-containing protein [Chloroflexota bacterium]
MTTSPEAGPLSDAAGQPPGLSARWLRRIVVLAFIFVAAGALYLAPHGLLGAADGVAYAVCHRIELRSFHLGERALPLCARCTGTFLGVFVGTALIIAAGRGRRSGWPRTPLILVLAALVVPWVVDGTNSYAALFGTLPTLYTPHNWLRLTTGTLVGLVLPVFLLPAVNQTLWREQDTRPVLGRFGELALYLAAAPILIGLVLPENALLLYPLALFSVIGVLATLCGVYLVLWLVILRSENRIVRLIEAWPHLLAALTLALLHIAAIDMLRFSLTGTWGGLPLGG